MEKEQTINYSHIKPAFGLNLIVSVNDSSRDISDNNNISIFFIEVEQQDNSQQV